MKKPISYLYREILLKVDEELTKYYSDEYEEDERVKEAIDIFRLGTKEVKLEDVENFDEDKCEELYKETNYETWIGEGDIVREVINKFRESGEEIVDKVQQDRYYCYQEVAKKITGSKDLYLGWTYYFGGGKHAQPDQVEWMEDCYLLKCREVEETRIVKVYLPLVDDNEKVEEQ